jgi:Short C-terminal domain
VNVGRMSVVSFGVFLICTIGLSVVARHQSGGVLGAHLALWILSFAYAMYLWIAVIRYGDRRLLKRGVKGTAEVLSSKETSWQMAAGEYYGIGAPNVWKYGLNVSLPGREPYATTLYICARLREGETVPIVAGRLNTKRVTVDLAAHAAAREATDAVPGSTKIRRRPAVTLIRQLAAAAAPDLADELTKLADLRDRGALTDAEFEAQKAKLLGTN